MKIFSTFFALITALILLVSPAFGLDDSAVSLDKSEARLISNHNSIAVGEPFQLAFHIIPAKDWHSYWENPGDSGAAPLLNWKTDAGVELSAPHYQAPVRIMIAGLMTYGYKGPSSLVFDGQLSDDFKGDSVTFTVEAEWLVCEDICIPQVATLALSVPVTAEPVKKNNTPIFNDFYAKQAEVSWWDSSLSINPDSASLTVAMSQDELRGLKTAYFFPRTKGVLDYASPQSIAKMPEGYILSFARPKGAAMPDDGSGILMLEKHSGYRLYFNLNPTLVNLVNGGPAADGAADSGASPQPIQLSIPLWQALIFALLGGVILNLMPCVFPVLSLKAFAFIQSGSMTKADRHREGWSYTAGILASFLVIAITLIALRSGGSAIGWGFQLQEPRFVGAMVIILVLVAMSLAGMFNISTGFEGAGQKLTESKGAKGAFFTGVLATLVATPCTVPLMAPAVGYALTQDSLTLTVTLMALGLGLALPFLILSYSDTLAAKMPRPGAWMERVKQGLAFPMLLTAFWLVDVYSEQTGSFLTLLFTVTLVAFAVWLREQLSGRVARAVIVIITLAGSLYFITSPKDKPAPTASDSAELSGTFTPERVEKLQAAGKPVFVYFTADWCITCKVNERIALKRDATQALFKDNDITVLKSDETTGFKPATLTILNQYGRAGIPLYLYYPKDGSGARLLPAVVTVDIIEDYITGKGV